MTVQSIKPALISAIKTIQARHDQKREVTGIPTGFVMLDVMTGGLHPGQLIVVAGARSMGATALASHFLLQAALEAKRPSLVFSLEKGRELFCERLLVVRGGVDSVMMKCGMLRTRDWTQLTEAATTLAESGIHIDDEGDQRVRQIARTAQAWPKTHAHLFRDDRRMGVIVVDTLNRVANRKISKAARGLKELAQIMQVPVIATVRIESPAEECVDKRPMFSDLRDVGAIEPYADVLIFVHREEVYAKDKTEEEDKGMVELIVPKNPSGMAGTVRLGFRAECLRFEDIE